MADAPDLSELVRRAIEANTRFYQGWVNLSLEYFRGITEIFGGVQSSVSEATSPTSTVGSDAVVLEAAGGAAASGAFLVTNDLGRSLKCELVASGFQGSDGQAAAGEVVFDPASFELAPGEQRVVRASVVVDGRLSAGAAYTGTFGIKGMQGFSVPVVLRRQHDVDVSPIDQLDGTGAAPKAATARTKAPGAKTTTSTRTASAKAKAAPKKAAKKKAAGKGASRTKA